MSDIVGEITKGVWHVIAYRSSKINGAGWRLRDDAIMSIDAAKELCDAGQIDMAQGRDESTFYLKVRFRMAPDKNRQPWFFRQESEHDQAVKRKINYVRGTRAKSRVSESLPQI